MSAVAEIEMVKDEAELLVRIRNGSPDEFGEIIRQHQGLVFSILYRYERDAQLIEDLAQDTFLKAWKALEQFDGRAPFSHWLSRIAVHVALDHLRKKRRIKNEIGFDELGEDALEWLHAEDERSELEPGQAREILEIAFRELTAEERMVLTLQELEGKSVKEICEVTGWTSVAARVRAFRARAKLKKVLLKMEKQKK